MGKGVIIAIFAILTVFSSCSKSENQPIKVPPRPPEPNKPPKLPDKRPYEEGVSCGDPNAPEGIHGIYATFHGQRSSGPPWSSEDGMEEAKANAILLSDGEIKIRVIPRTMVSRPDCMPTFSEKRCIRESLEECLQGSDELDEAGKRCAFDELKKCLSSNPKCKELDTDGETCIAGYLSRSGNYRDNYNDGIEECLNKKDLDDYGEKCNRTPKNLGRLKVEIGVKGTNDNRWNVGRHTFGNIRIGGVSRVKRFAVPSGSRNFEIGILSVKGDEHCRSIIDQMNSCRDDITNIRRCENEWDYNRPSSFCCKVLHRDGTLDYSYLNQYCDDDGMDRMGNSLGNKCVKVEIQLATDTTPDFPAGCGNDSNEL